MSISILNFSPSGQYVNPDFTVSFDIVSDDDPIDLSSLNVYFNDSVFTDPAILGGDFQDGYDGAITATSVNGDPGYNIEIFSNTIFRDSTVAIRVEADTNPSSGLATFTETFSTATYIGVFATVNSFLGLPAEDTGEADFNGAIFSGKNNNVLFQINDKTEPVITNRIPVPNSTNISRNTNIQFGLHDNGGQVNISSLNVFVNGDQIIINGAFISPFTGSITPAIIDGFPGFNVFVNNPEQFLFNQEVPVRVIVSDTSSDPTTINTLDTTYIFTIENFIDVDPPEFTLNQPPEGFDPNGCIEFDWLDAPQGPGPDLSTLNITLIRELVIDCITSVTEDVAVIGGVAQDPPPGVARYELFAEPIEVGLQKGFSIILCPVTPFNELETITVVVDGYDSNGNESGTDFNISTKETTPPRILNFNPADGQTGVNSQSSIEFDIHDFSGVGVELSKLSVNVDMGEAVINGAAQPGFTLVTESKFVVDELGLQFDGYGVSITRDAPFDPSELVNVFIDAYDGYDNRAIEEISFTIEPDVTPPVIIVDPPNNSVQRPRDQIITVEIIDPNGVEQSATSITVAGNQAVLSGSGVLPFDVVVEEIFSAPGVVDGYRYTVDTEFDFAFAQVVPISVSCADIFGNQNTRTTRFTAFRDTNPPVISDITPRDGQREVSLRPEITFTARDAYDVAFELTEVTVGDIVAISGGLVQSDFSMNQTRIDGGTPGVSPGDGYSIILTPVQDFNYGESIDVNIRVFDRSNNNLTEETVSWTVNDPRPPVFDIVPEDGSVGFDVDGNINIEVLDDGYKFDINTLNVLIDEQDAVVNGVVQEPNYVGTVTEIIDGYHYSVEINPRFLLDGSTTHEIIATANEVLANNQGRKRVSFITGPAPANPETVYIATDDGVESIQVAAIGNNVQPAILIDGYHVLDLQAKVLKEINRLLVGTRDSGAFVYGTNYNIPSLFYSLGDEITHVHLSNRNNGTLYLANRTRSRVDVYYNILFDDVGRDEPDVFYAPPPAGNGDGYVVPGMIDGYFTSMVVDEMSSTVDSSSPRIFLGTPEGAMRIDTDESVLTETEVNGVIYTYGIPGSGYDFNILDGTTNYVVDLDVNSRLNYLYVATRSEDSADQNALTYINLADNSFDGSIPESRLINRLINNINFKDS